LGPFQKALRTLCMQTNNRYCEERGNASAPIAILLEAPGENEEAKGIAAIGGAGKELDRILCEAGIGQVNVECWIDNPYVCRPPGNDIKKILSLGISHEDYIKAFLEKLYERRPTIIIAGGATPLSILCPQCKSIPTAQVKKEKNPFQIMKWRGSLLTSPLLNWPHYVIPMCHPSYVLRDWSERQVSVLIVAKALEELNYWKKHGSLQPLPKRNILVQPDAGYILNQLNTWHSCSLRLASDIETIRNKINKKNFVYTIALSPSPEEAISFCLWDLPEASRGLVFRKLNDIHRDNPLIGQNFRIFDSHWLGETLGFEVNPFHVHDTLERHHTLHPEMEHSLQFLTLQYTREPFYKDEGKSVSAKNKSGLLRYGGKDTCVTYEVFLEQEKEFACR